jgi:hypothetical protein
MPSPSEIEIIENIVAGARARFRSAGECENIRKIMQAKFDRGEGPIDASGTYDPGEDGRSVQAAVAAACSPGSSAPGSAGTISAAVAAACAPGWSSPGSAGTVSAAAAPPRQFFPASVFNTHRDPADLRAQARAAGIAPASPAKKIDTAEIYARREREARGLVDPLESEGAAASSSLGFTHDVYAARARMVAEAARGFRTPAPSRPRIADAPKESRAAALSDLSTADIYAARAAQAQGFHAN